MGSERGLFLSREKNKGKKSPLSKGKLLPPSFTKREKEGRKGRGDVGGARKLMISRLAHKTRNEVSTRKLNTKEKHETIDGSTSITTTAQKGLTQLGGDPAKMSPG